MNLVHNLVEPFTAHGFVILDRVLDSREVDSLRDAVACLPADQRLPGGIRGALRKSPLLSHFAENGPPAVAAKAVLGTNARAVQGTLFDKSARGNWKVPWHQDLTIAVAQRIDVSGFEPWSVKEGIPHVQPPVEILENLVAVRVHLDETGPDNGALRVIPGSHRRGKLAPREIDELKRLGAEVVCPVGRGGLMLMAPLLLHASSASTEATHRRVLHIEYAAISLPGGLEWKRPMNAVPSQSGTRASALMASAATPAQR